MGGEMLRLYVASAAEVRSLLDRARADTRVADRLALVVAPQLDEDLSPTALVDLLTGARVRPGDDRATRWRALEALIAALSWHAGGTGPYNRSWLPDFDRQLARGGVPTDLRLESLMRVAGIPGLKLDPAATGMATVLPPAAVARVINSWSASREKMTEPDVTDDVLSVARQVPAVANRAAVLGRGTPDLIWVFGGLGLHAPLSRPDRWADHVRRANFEPDRLAGVSESELWTFAIPDGPGRQHVLRWRISDGTASASWLSSDATSQWNGQLSVAWGQAFEAAIAATSFPTAPAATDDHNFLLRIGEPVAGRQVLGSVRASRRNAAWSALLDLLSSALATLCGRSVDGVDPDRRWVVPLQ